MSSIELEVPYLPIEILNRAFDPRIILPHMASEFTDDDVFQPCEESPRHWMDIHNCTATNISIVAGRRGSKSTGANGHLVAFKALRCPRETVKRFQGSLKCGYMGPVLKQTRRIIWERMKALCHNIMWPKSSPNETNLEIKLMNGMWLQLYGSDSDPDSLEGFPFWFILCDESADQNPKIFDEHIEPSLSDEDLVTAGGGRSMHTGTPKGMGNHFYSKYLKGLNDQTGEWKSFRWASWQNPRVNLVKLAYRYHRLREEGNLGLWLQENCAEFVNAAGAIYSNFSRNTHVIPFEIHDDWDMFVSIDNGADDPTAAVIGAIDHFGRIWVRHEYYMRDKPISEHCRRIGEICMQYGGINGHRFKYRIMDQTNRQLFHEYSRCGFRMSAAGNAKDKKIPMIRRVQEIMVVDKNSGLPGLIFHPECVTTIAQHETYEWKEKPPGKPDQNSYETPKKKNDHTVDAVQYIAWRRPQAAKQNKVDNRTMAQRIIDEDLSKIKARAMRKDSREYDIDPVIGGWI